MNYRILLPLLLTVLPGLASAEIYRWVDPQGRLQYTQTPPPDAQYRKIDPRVSPASTDAAEALHQQAEAMGKAREEETKKVAAAEAKAQQRSGACVQAQQRLKLMDENPPNRLSSTNDQGERERWTPEKHAAERAKAQQVADENCTSAAP